MMQAKQTCDALIVGAGPVGLTMGLELARCGLRCRIVDRAALPTDKSKAVVIWPRTLELLDKLGVADAFVADGLLIRGGAIYGNRRKLTGIPVDLPDSQFPRPLMLPQSETERLLNDHLQRGGRWVERPVEFSELVDLGDHAEATLVHGDGSQEHVCCAWLIGCDGAHSTVRKALGIEFAGTFEPNDWLLADVDIDGPIARDEMSIFWHASGIVAFFPIDRRRVRIVADCGAASCAEKPPEPTLEQVQAIVDQRGPRGLRLHDPIWLSGFRIHERKVADYSRGRVFLAGDAAHIHSPAGGQGMNTGMQDAFNLAWKLALAHHGNGKLPTLLDSYSQERSAIGDRVLRNAGFMTRMATLRNPILQALRNGALSIAARLPSVQRRMVAELTEMAINYSNSSLNGEARSPAWTTAVRPGDRLPDAVCSDAQTGQPVRLLQAMRDPVHILLLLPNSAASVESLVEQAGHVVHEYEGLIRSVLVLPPEYKHAGEAQSGTILIDVQHEVRDRLGLRDSAIALIRPDGYIGFCGGATSFGELRRHVTGYLVAPVGSLTIG